VAPIVYLAAGLGVNGGAAENGDPVNSWADQSGNGNDFAQSVTRLRPTYVRSGPGSQPAISFTLSGSHLYNDVQMLANNGTPFTLFVVCEPNGYDLEAPANYGIPAFAGILQLAIPPLTDPNLTVTPSNALRSAPFLRFVNPLALDESNYWYLNYGSSNSYGFPAVLSASSFSAINRQYCISLSYDGSNVLIYSGTSGTSQTVTPCDTLLGYNPLAVRNYLGMIQGGEVGLWSSLTGTMSEFLLYPGVLSGSDRAAVLSYLNSKYGAISP
jgi:hypothetical protein